MEVPTAPNRRWFRFALSHLFVLVSGIAFGFAPFKLWELTADPQPQIYVHLKCIELADEQLVELGIQEHEFPVSGIPVADLGSSFPAKLAGLIERQQAKVLSEPTLVTVNGRPCSFNVGGEMPVSVVTPDGVASVEYREFGTTLSVLPTLLRNGLIRLEVESELSAIEQASDEATQEEAPPSYRHTKSSTVAELRGGETIVLCLSSPEPTTRMLFLAKVERDTAR
jgi:hypothetical protein